MVYVIWIMYREIFVQPLWFYVGIVAIILIGTPNRNRTCNCPLGGGCYIHLTMKACVMIERFFHILKSAFLLYSIFTQIAIVFANIILTMPKIIKHNRRL